MSQKFYLPTTTLPTWPFSRACFADYWGILIKPFIRVSVINFNHGEGLSKQNKKTRQHYTYYYRIIYDTSK